MDPTEPRRNMPMPGEPGTPEERHFYQLSNGMTLEGNHIASSALDTVAALFHTPWASSKFTYNRGGPFLSQAPVPLILLI